MQSGNAVESSQMVEMFYLVDSWNPPMAYGSGSEGTLEQMDDTRAATVKKSRQSMATAATGEWSSSNFVARSALPMSAADQPQRVGMADNFKQSKKSRATVSGKLPPSVLGFAVGSSIVADSVDAMCVNLDATIMAASIESKTLVWNLQGKSSHSGEHSPGKLYNSLFVSKPGESACSIMSGKGTTCLSIAPDAPVLLTGTSRGQVALWSVEGSHKLVSYTGHTSRTPVWSVAWAPAALYFATGAGDSVARIWRSDVPFPIRILPVSDGHAHIVKWHPSCQLVAVASANHVTVFEIASAQSLFRFNMKAVTALEFSPTGYLLAAANADSLTVWDMNAGAQLFQHDTFNSITNLAWSFPSAAALGDGGLKSVTGSTGVGHPVLVSVEGSGKLRLWDKLFVSKPSLCEMATSQPMRPHHMHFTPRNLLVLAGTPEAGYNSIPEGLPGL